jgi:hypothetical protein
MATPPVTFPTAYVQRRAFSHAVSGVQLRFAQTPIAANRMYVFHGIALFPLVREFKKSGSWHQTLRIFLGDGAGIGAPEYKAWQFPVGRYLSGTVSFAFAGHRDEDMGSTQAYHITSWAIDKPTKKGKTELIGVQAVVKWDGDSLRKVYLSYTANLFMKE